MTQQAAMMDRKWNSPWGFGAIGARSEKKRKRPNWCVGVGVCRV